MTWLIDTNIISEIRKGARCDPNVASWWRAVDPADIHLSVLVIGEIRRGITLARRRDQAKADALDAWLATVIDAFAGRIQPIDTAVAERWGHLAGVRTIPAIDGLLAATADIHGLTLVTRNTADIAGLGVRTLDPFAATFKP